MSRILHQRAGGNFIRNRFCRLLTAVISCGLFLVQGLTVLAEPSEAERRLEAQRAMEIQSNQVENWPIGPVVGAEAAILMEAETGTILYSKNIHKHEYPASTTKLLTTLIAIEQCSMDDIVPITQEAVSDTPRDSNHIALDAGEALTLEQCLNAVLIRSANEAAFALGAYIAEGSWHDFADIMNERAEELGCLNSHFVNPNGLPDDDHYTTAYDLAMIGRAFFANEMLCQITLTRRLEIPASDLQPDNILEINNMQIIPGGQYEYQYLIGCKTGFTNASRSCLVSAAERDGMKLICVVLRDEAPYQYEDTISLFEYGFSNFEKVNVSQTETKYDIDNTGLFYSGNDIFGSSSPILSLNKNDYIIIPRTATFDDLDSTISYDETNPNQAAVITYTYQGVDIGSVRVNFTVNQSGNHLFDAVDDEDNNETSEKNDAPVIYVNVIRVLLGMAAAAVIAFIVLLVKRILKNYQISIGGRRRNWRRDKRHRRKKAKRPNRFRDFDF